MKKKAVQKLILNRETVRLLEARELGNVQGGTVFTWEEGCTSSVCIAPTRVDWVCG